MISVHRQLTRLAAPWAARKRGRTARTLWRFALAELSSAIIMRHAARHCEDATRAALYLRHAIDEERHARMFVRRARTLGDEAGVPVGREPLRADGEDLYGQMGEARFIAMVHRGEGRGRREFESYIRAFERSGDPTTARLFEAIVVDEWRHERYTAELLQSLAPEPGRRRQLLRAVVLWELWRLYRRLGRSLAVLLFSLVCWLSYLLAWPWGLALRLRTTPVGWRPPAR